MATASSHSRSTRGDGERVERRRRGRIRAQISLTCSNGSAQARQRRSALHAVAPKRDDLLGVGRAARGHGDARSRAATRVSGTGPGGVGAAPARAARSRPRRACAGPSAVIQSVVHARRQLACAPDVGVPAALQGAATIVAHRLERRAAGVGRGDGDDDAAVRRRSTSREDAELGQRQQRQLRVGAPARRPPAARSAAVTTPPPGRRGRRSAARRAGRPRAAVCTPSSGRLTGHPGRRRRRDGSVAAAQHRAQHLVELRAQRRPGRRRHRPRRAAARPRAAGTARRRTASTRVQAACIRCVRELGAVAEAHHPLRGVVAVVGELLDALGGDRREHRVARARAARSNSASRHVANTSSRATQLGEVAVGAARPAARCGTRAASRK